MKLLQVNLQRLLTYALILVLISIPVSLISVQTLFDDEVDETIAHQADRFLQHIKQFEHLDDLPTDLEVLNELSYNVDIHPYDGTTIDKHYQTVTLYDSVVQSDKPFRQLSSSVSIQGKPYLLTVRMPLVDNSDLILTISLVQLVVSILLVVGLILLNKSFSINLWKPFYKTLEQLKAYQLDRNASIPIEPSSIDEFNDLNRAVSELTERNRKVFLAQKEFIENASHELQTPIAIFQSKIDSLMQSPDLTKTQADALADLESTAVRVARLNKHLLLLSKIDNGQFISKENVDVSTVLMHQIENVQPIAALEKIEIEWHLSHVSLYTNRPLLEVLISNVLHNAIRYSEKNSSVSVLLENKILSVSNKGTQLKMNLGQLTQRFSKESSDPNSSGLGLAIVKKICDTFGYSLNYLFENGTHTFSVDFSKSD